MDPFNFLRENVCNVYVLQLPRTTTKVPNQNTELALAVSYDLAVRSEEEEEKEEEEKVRMSSGQGQGHMTAAVMDKALPATRLLEKCRLMFQMQEALECQKIEFARKEEVLQKREEDLKAKDRELQESLIGFSKFLQENNAKRARAEKKATDEIRIQQEKEAEIKLLETKLEELQHDRNQANIFLVRMLAYQKYLESVVDISEEYHEINDLLMRHAMLTSTNDDLKKHIEECTESNEIMRMELQDYSKVSQNEILNLENDLRFLKQTYMERKKETSDMQLRMDSILQEAASKTLLRGQVCMAAENMFARVLQCSKIKHPDYTSPIKQLDVIGDYITDVNESIKSYKGSSYRKD